MIMTNKLLPVALIAALIGGSVGALVMHKSQPASAETTAQTTPSGTAPIAGQAGNEVEPTEGEQTAYKTGFADGYTAGTEKGTTAARGSSRVVYRNGSARSSSSARRVYDDYNQPKGRSFWDKHRDKLTVAIGTGAGAAVWWIDWW